MGQRRKKRYRSKPNPYPPIVMTGRAGLKYQEEFQLESVQPGDLQFFMFRCSLGRKEAEPGYDYVGGSGYLKARVYDGKEWHLVVMDDLLPGREHHFSKTEMPLDTFLICRDKIAELTGTKLQRGYRMHYEPVSRDDDSDEFEE